MAATGARALRIAFCHPDLGLGGAERLIVDAAQELGSRGHDVDVYTAYYDPKRCFEETKSGSFRVLVRGNCFPRSIGNRAMALCAYMRCLLMALSVCIVSIMRPSKRHDVVIVDQVSITNLVFRLLCPQTRVLFYCHFPDLLLAKPSSWLHRMYRSPLDALEQASTGMAHRVLVNSEFTKGVFKETFKVLDARGVVPDVLYPAVVIPNDAAMDAMRASWKSLLPPEVVGLMTSRPTFLSINRYERKKNIGLAIRALALVGDGMDGGPKPGLVVAGGYDERLLENVQHLEELKSIVKVLELDDRITFMTSFTDDQRLALLCGCCAVTYTPTNEHFGIVPIETMAAATPVIACDSGGPKESIVDQETGYLQQATPEAFAEAMRACLGAGRASGEKARARVEALFSRHAFGDALEDIVVRLVDDDRKLK